MVFLILKKKTLFFARKWYFFIFFHSDVILLCRLIWKEGTWTCTDLQLTFIKLIPYCSSQSLFLSGSLITHWINFESMYCPLCYVSPHWDTITTSIFADVLYCITHSIMVACSGVSTSSVPPPVIVAVYLYHILGKQCHLL